MFWLEHSSTTPKSLNQLSLTQPFFFTCLIKGFLAYSLFTVISGKQPLVFQTIINMIWLLAGSTRFILGHIVKKIVINVHLNHIHDSSSSISVVRLKNK